MRRFYSFMLMAAALLFGTNVWAANVTVSISQDVAEADYYDLQQAINAAGTGTVTLLSSMALTEPVWIGPADGSENGTAQSVVLNLNGKTISMTPDNADAYMFVLGKGTLEVKNGKIKLLGTPTASSNLFTVYGTYNNTANYSHLIIGEEAEVTANNGTIIAVMEKGMKDGKYKGAYGQVFTNPTEKGFLTDYFAGSYGLAMGVVVDVKAGATLNVGATGNDKTYGIKVNGLIERPTSTSRAKRSVVTTKAYEAGMSGLSITSAFDENVPYIHVWKGASITSAGNIAASAAIYASGYAHWLIEGTCVGNVGASISSGEVAFNDAIINSNATGYAAANGENHVSGSGIGIVVNSRGQNAGDIDVVISGETKITTDATAGVAVQEQVTSATATEVENITIESGSFQGGSTGAIIVTGASADKVTIFEADIASTGATPIAVVDANGDPVDNQASAIASLLPEGTDASAGATQDSQTGKWVIDFTAGYNVTLNAAGLATFSADKRTLIPDGVKVYKAGSMSGDLLSITRVNENGEKYIPANTGVLLYGEANASISIAVNTSGSETVADFDGNKFHAATEWADNDNPETKDIIEGVAREDAYILHDNELWQYTGTAMKPNKAYLIIDGQGAASAPARIRMVIAETQDVENIEAGKKAVKFIQNGNIFIKRGEKIYNVQGQIVK